MSSRLRLLTAVAYLLTLASLPLLLACGAEPASSAPRSRTTSETAIVAGTPVPDSLLNVGTTAVKIGGEWFWGVCSGTLVSPRVFVSAAHCYAEIKDQYVWGVTFAASVPPYTSLPPDVTVFPAQLYLHPDFTWDDSFDQFSTDPDVAVFVLDEPAHGVKPAELVGPGYFDRHQEHLIGRTFGIAGYGITAPDQLDTLEFDFGTRRFATMKLSEVFPGMVVFDPGPGGGTPCMHDSGGPALPIDADAKRFPRNVDVLTSITRAVVPGEPFCGGGAIYTRLDTPAVQSFIRGFMKD